MQACKRALLLIMCLMQLATAWAQNAFAENYIAEAKDGRVYLRWTMKSGKTCDGITIARSPDGKVYRDIHIVSGVCGSEDSAQVFVYTDNSPELGKTNYYRLTFGTSSQVLELPVFVFAGNGYALYPNPTSGNTRLYFSNSNNDDATFRLYSLSGKLVHQQHSAENSLNIDCSYLPAGVYIFQLQMLNRSINGKVVVVH